jgi:hypothetical protein
VDAREFEEQPARLAKGYLDDIERTSIHAIISALNRAMA